MALTTERVALIEEKARFVRTETVRLIDIAKTGHYASVFSCAEILAVLYYDVLNLRRDDATWPHRDRLLLGKGHAAVGLYPLLADWGYLPVDVLNSYTRLGNPLGDHPDMTKVPGVDFSSGSLGHNLSVGLGMTLAARITGYDFRTFVLLGDGELEEGQVWEAAMSAAHHKANRLVAIVDRNRYSLDGKADDINKLEPIADKWAAFGWTVTEVDGHDIRQLSSALHNARDSQSDRPTVVIAHTLKGKGVEFMEEDFGWHLGWLDTEDLEFVNATLGTTP
jgi:transketolase